ncbi:hypothetical protein NBRC116493_23250 [Aurantivibrio infirmus]
MNNKILVILVIGLTGCSSVYENAYQGLTKKEYNEGGYFYTYWVEQEKFMIDPNSSFDQEIARADLVNCKIELEDKEITKHVRNRYIATVALIDCMDKKGWKATFSSIVMLM